MWNSWRDFHGCANLVKAKAKDSGLQHMRTSHLPYTDMDNDKGRNGEWEGGAAQGSLQRLKWSYFDSSTCWGFFLNH